MRMINGKEILDSPEELTNPSHAALVLVDIQNDYVSKGGVLHQLGYDISPMQAMVQTVRRLIDAARLVEVPLLYLQDTRLADSRSEAGSFLRFLTIKCGLPPNVTLQGTWGWAFPDAIAPEPQDIVVPKFRESGFVGTSLDLMLRSNRIQTIVMVGDVTQGCVESTARDALFSNYYVVVVRDGVASYNRELHETSLRVMERKFDVFNAEEIISLWSGADINAQEGQAVSIPDRGS